MEALRTRIKKLKNKTNVEFTLLKIKPVMWKTYLRKFKQNAD